MELRTLFSSILIAAIVTACASSGTNNTPVESAPPASPQTPIIAPPNVGTPVAEADAERLVRLSKSLAGKSVYFNYDDFSVKPQYADAVKLHADVLSSIRKSSVVIEGNADERGSTEYNLALGQKRADAVGKALQILGVGRERIETISYGREKPRSLCHEERCWAENRRADFNLKMDR